MKELKAKIEKFNNEYNIIKLYRDDIVEFYLEKIGYANLLCICGIEDDIELSNDYIYELIKIARKENFWGD